MNFLYIGPYQPGNTCYQRGQVLKKLVGDPNFHVIDTTIPFNATSKIFLSLAYHTVTGPYITRLNNYIIAECSLPHYDMIWIDKGNFIQPYTVSFLKKKTEKLIHYTPDCAFFANKSRLFEKSMKYYDLFLTTKSFELDYYPADRTILTTQGYDPEIHKPWNTFEEKDTDVSFIGLYEKSRGQFINQLIDSGISVSIGGMGWKKKYKNLNHPNITFLGDRVFGEEYGKIISRSKISLGLVSKRFPEQYTTRSFEIPACGTALVAEDNSEIRQYFGSDEAIFYKNPNDAISATGYYLKDSEALKSLSLKGKARIEKNKLGYPSIISHLFEKVVNE